jgi:uncharacterized membrane protein
MQRLARIVIALALLAAFGIAVWAYPQLPARVPSHWNAAGEVDGYSSRAFGAFGLPSIMLGLTALLLALPSIDPLKKNIASFRTEYEVFIAVFELFFLLLYVQTILWALGTEISINAVVSLGCGMLYLTIGWMISRAKRNFFIGIRTPWTLMNDEVWDRTHALGSKLFYAAGVIALLGVFVPDYAMWLILVPTLAATAITVVYSYLIYQQIAPKNGMNGPPPARG